MSQALASKIAEHHGNGHRTAAPETTTDVFERYESNIRTYCRSFSGCFCPG